MSRQTRIRTLIAIVAVFAAVLVVFSLTQRNQPTAIPITDAVTPLSGTIALYHNGAIVTFFTPSSLTGLEESGFEDRVEGKRQNGVLLSAIILHYVAEAELSDDTLITVASSERDKSVTLTWSQVANPENHVLFDPSSNRGTLKLVSSSIENLDERAEWIQDTERIDIETP